MTRKKTSKPNSAQQTQLDSVRASRDGHEYHEAWAARKCLGLLFPRDQLIGVAIEGFSPVDRNSMSRDANDIADAVLYFGPHPSFNRATRVVVVQVKYSKAAQLIPFRAADAKKTLQKFGATYRAYKRQYGTAVSRKKLRFELVTNRPILPELQHALRWLAAPGSNLRGVAETQAAQVTAACGLAGVDLREFSARLKFTGSAGELSEVKHKLAVSLADWSPARDAWASIRLAHVRQLAREKAGLAHQHRNVITRADMLTALELQDERELLPCPACFPVVGPVVERVQLEEIVARIPLMQRPLVVHADGGVGKTVFINSIAARLAESNEVVLFDCFGGGTYRDPGDARHLPRRGLVHIANDLACRGLCDPLLPGTDNSDDIIRAFRIRLEQAASHLRGIHADRHLVVLLDAIDNSYLQASARHEDSFPTLLLAHFTATGPIEGVHLVVSARTHRRLAATGGADVEELELKCFTVNETREFLQARLNALTEIAVEVAQSRSRGNARVLEHLAAEGADLLAPSEAGKVVELDELLRNRIASALSQARSVGYTDEEIRSFLAGLATLPPPVPADEFAQINELPVGAVRSFAADLAPLLEQTRHGLMFRDEPTEDLLTREYSADTQALERLSKRLYEMQGASAYAAASLPDFLARLGDSELLFRLAFDERMPSTIRSAVSQQVIRRSRLRAAIADASKHTHFDRLVALLVEMSTITALEQRGTQFLLDYPDLTVLSTEVDSMRRLFEVRTRWPGTRHARLAIAHALTGEVSDAYQHAHRLTEWTTHYFEQDEDYRRDTGGPTALDMTAVPFCLIVKGEGINAARQFDRWFDWFAYETAERLFALLRIGCNVGGVSAAVVDEFVAASSRIGVLAAACEYVEPKPEVQRSVVRALAVACNSDAARFTMPKNDFRRAGNLLQRGLLCAGAIAVVQGMNAEANAITALAGVQTPRLHVFTRAYWSDETGAFLAQQVLVALASKSALSARALLPLELAELATTLGAIDDSELPKALKNAVLARYETERAQKGATFDYSTKTDAERFIDSRLPAWLRFANAFSSALASGDSNEPPSLTALLEVWAELRARDDYLMGGEARLQYAHVGAFLVTVALKANPLLAGGDVQRCVELFASTDQVTPEILTEVVECLARRRHLASSAGLLAKRAMSDIQREDDVDNRASHFAGLGRAIFAASREEAVEYFRIGLEQLDAIGSGDYQFANELLDFAGSLQGAQMEDRDCHTLSNICELNLGEEHKFNWAAYGTAMARVSGCRGLAKLTRWEDRDRISLDYTLLPYVRGLLDAGAVDMRLALVMLRVSDPVELYVCGTGQLVDAMRARAYTNEECVRTLVHQYLQNNPGSLDSKTAQLLAQLALEVLSAHSPEYQYLCSVEAAANAGRNELNRLNNWREPERSYTNDERQAEERAAAYVSTLAATVKADDEVSMTEALVSLDGQMRGHRLSRDFLEIQRAKVEYQNQPAYLKFISRQDSVQLYDKLFELRACKAAWIRASSAVSTALRECAEIVIRHNAFDFLGWGYVSGSLLQDLADTCGVARQPLMLQLVREFSAPDRSISASVWLGIASEFNVRAQPGVAQRALKRLLSSGAAKLASSAQDGAWTPRLAAPADPLEAAAGLIWFSLGSPQARRRWMGAHSLRLAASFGKDAVVDLLVARYGSTDAEAFQASELTFFYFHARLWLLIALARTAIDQPSCVARHAAFLQQVALNAADHLVLHRHFAVQALFACQDRGALTFDANTAKALKAVNKSPFPVVIARRYGGAAHSRTRPGADDLRDQGVYFEYDFDKYEVTGLGELFARPHWETAHAMSEWVRLRDPKITHMSDHGGRRGYQRDGIRGISDAHHSYGEQLCWHALHATAGAFLRQFPLVREQYERADSDPWAEWMRDRVIARDDGLWFADGIDWRPAETLVNGQEADETGVGLTSSPARLLQLVGIQSVIADWLVLDAEWSAIDGVKVIVQSACAPATRSEKLAASLALKDPFQVFLPRPRAYEDGEPEYLRRNAPYTSLVVIPEGCRGLDDADALGTREAAGRPRPSNELIGFGCLTPDDSFERSWSIRSQGVAVRSRVWRQTTTRDEEAGPSGSRLEIRTDLLSSFLTRQRADLLLLVVLRKYRAAFGHEPSRFWHTTAVVRVSPALEFSFYLGKANELHKSRY